MAQILGRRLFWGRAFRVTSDTLDPRPETEALFAAALEEPFARLLDLGTGTGCILLTLLSERPGATGVGTARMVFENVLMPCWWQRPWTSSRSCTCRR